MPQDLLFTHAKFPVLCYSKLRSSLAVLLPTVSDWSPLLPQCMPGWGPQWPVASAECPRSAPDGHHLKIVQMGPVSTLLSGCDTLAGTWSVSTFSLHVHYCFLFHYRKKEPSVCERCINLPAVQMWQEECGAHAMPLTQARWLLRRATGVHGTLTSSIITCNREMCQYVNGHHVNVMVKTDQNVACCFMQAQKLFFNIKWNAGCGVQQFRPYR